MSIQKTINLGITTLFALFAVVLYTGMHAVYADEDVEEVTPVTVQEEQSEDENEQEGEDTATYEYVAQPGDSYSKMARKALQTFGLETETNLSGAQIVFAETNLTLAAGSPVLALGDQISISRSLVSEWVERAKELSEDRQAQWQVYADQVDFNTDNVGEARE